MFLKLSSKLRRSIGLKLAIWYFGFFSISMAVLFVLGFILASQSIKAKDQRIVKEMLNRYEIIAQNKNTSKLIATLRNEQIAHVTGGYLVAVTNGEDDIIYISLPYEWRSVDISYFKKKLSLQKGDWFSLSTTKYLPPNDVSPRTDTLEITGVAINEDTKLYLGNSAEIREEFLEHIRDIFLIVMIPMAIISLVVGAILARRAMQPVQGLTETIKNILSGQLETRAPLSETENELKDLARHFNAMLDRIEELITGMHEALDNVAHDLRTPLTRMKISIEEAAVSDDSKTLKEALFDCAEESTQIADMLTTLMDISEAEAGVMQLNYSEFRITELLTEILNIYDFVAKEKNIIIKLSPEKDLSITGDRNRLRQAISNVIDNAVKYTEMNGRIRIDINQSDENIELSIEDNGVGIEPTDINKIFDRLYRADKSRSQKGLGLGLSVVQAVVRAHGGDINVESVPGNGTTFKIQLPKIKIKSQKEFLDHRRKNGPF